MGLPVTGIAVKGAKVGDSEGLDVDGDVVGCCVGRPVTGIAVGGLVGDPVSASVGSAEGSCVGKS